MIVPLGSWVPWCYWCHWHCCLWHQDGRHLYWIQNLLSCRPPHHEEGLGPRVTGVTTLIRVVGFMGATTAGGVAGPESWVASMADGTGSQVLLPPCPVPCGCGHHCSWKAGYVCAAFPDATGFSGAAGSATAAGGPGSQAHNCSPCSISSLCSSPPTFRCTDVWNSPSSWSTGQRQLCWAMGVLMVLDWRGEKKGAFHDAVMLTSLKNSLLIVQFKLFQQLS